MIIPKHYLLFENWMVLRLQKKTWIPFTQGNFVPSLFEIGTVILEKNFRFRYYLSLEKGMSLYLNKLESSSPENVLCQVWLKLAQLFWRRFFKISLFRNFLPVKKGVVLNLNKLESSRPSLLCAKFGWNWPCGSGEVDENVKSLRTDGQTVDGRQAIRSEVS